MLIKNFRQNDDGTITVTDDSIISLDGKSTLGNAFIANLRDTSAPTQYDANAFAKDLGVDVSKLTGDASYSKIVDAFKAAGLSQSRASGVLGAFHNMVKESNSKLDSEEKAALEKLGIKDNDAFNTRVRTLTGDKEFDMSNYDSASLAVINSMLGKSTGTVAPTPTSGSTSDGGNVDPMSGQWPAQYTMRYKDKSYGFDPKNPASFDAFCNTELDIEDDMNPGSTRKGNILELAEGEALARPQFEANSDYMKSITGNGGENGGVV